MPARIDIPEDVLYQKYVVEELSAYQISDIFECSTKCIYNNLRRYNISVRSRNETKSINIDRNLLYKQYVIDKRSAVDISKLLNVSDATIYKYLNMYNIPIRSFSDAQVVKNDYTFTKWDLYYYYIIKEMSSVEIAKIFNCNHQLINFWLHKYNIPIRDKSENFSGSKNGNWKGGITEQKYCYKFNNSFKEYIRDKFNRTCYICGKTENELNKKLSVHHIDYNKSSICNGKEWAFVPLCASCHSKTNGNRWYWFNLLINYWLDKYEIPWVM